MSFKWIHDAIEKIESDFNRSADTHLIKLPSCACPEIDIYLKDESIHPSGSLKHRLARSLFLYAICNGWIGEDTPVVEISSGSTAISEAYFAQLLNLPFHTVIPPSTSKEKIHKIEFLGGTCHLCEGRDMRSTAVELARGLDGHFMDQFTFAERATDWRGNNNIAESLFRQMERERFPVPKWIVVGAGTGGTSATIGRFIRYMKLPTKLCVVDPEHSVYFDYFHSRDPNVTCDLTSRVEGIGRSRVEMSFVPTVIDTMKRVPDAAAFAAIHVLESLIDRKCGGSTGTNLWAVAELVANMRKNGQSGSIVTLICDAGERYLDSYYNDTWLANVGLDVLPYRTRLEEFLRTGSLDPV